MTTMVNELTKCRLVDINCPICRKKEKKMTKDDRRVRKTKLLLQESLAALFSQKGLQNITIRELTDYADVHRSTFYAHYDDIYALYRAIENKVIIELSDLIIVNFTLDSKEYYEILLDYVDQNRQFCKMLFSEYAPASFLARLTELFKEACIKSWENFPGKTELSEELLYLVDYHVQGCFTMVRKWTSADFLFSKEKLVSMIATIDERIAKILAKRLV